MARTMAWRHGGESKEKENDGGAHPCAGRREYRGNRVFYVLHWLLGFFAGDDHSGTEGVLYNIWRKPMFGWGSLQFKREFF
jgi:hypothetical protein